MPNVRTLADAAVWICWGAFALVWVAGAFYNARRAPHARRRSFVSSAWMLLAIPAWLAARRVLGVDAFSFSVEPEVVRLLGVVVLVLATGFTLWARVVLGTMWSSAPVARERHVLHTGGPYAVTRHPIYTGILGMLLGTTMALDFGSWVYVLVLVAVFVELRVRDEERLLKETFPAAYEAYRRRVPQLIPGLPARARSDSASDR